MSNKPKRLISAIIILTLMFSLSIPAFADEEKPVYLCLGDSIASGAALMYDGSEYTPEKMNNACLGFAFETMDNAYHSIVAKAIDAEIVQGARAGMRTSELRAILGGGYNDYDNTHVWFNAWADWSKYDNKGIIGNHRVGWNCAEGETVAEKIINGFEGEDDYANNIKYADEIRKADVITLNFGSNDVFCSPLLTALVDKSIKLFEEQPENPIVTDLRKTIDNEGIMALISKIFELNGKVEIITDMVTSFLRDSELAMIKFKENYKWVVDKIHALNPDAIIIGVGVFNPLRAGTISEDINIDISAAMALTTDRTNNYIRSFALTRDYYYYADVNDTETHPFSFADFEYMTVEGFSGGEVRFDKFLEVMMVMHPTIAGHKYMAEKIINAIPKNVGGCSTSKFVDILNTTILARGINSFYQRVSLMFAKLRALDIGALFRGIPIIKF